VHAPVHLHASFGFRVEVLRFLISGWAGRFRVGVSSTDGFGCKVFEFRVSGTHGMSRPSPHENNHFTETCSGSEAGSYLRLIDLCITQL